MQSARQPNEWSVSTRKNGQEELEVIQAAQTEKTSLLLDDLQDPNTILVLSPNEEPLLTRLTWQTLEDLCATDPRALQEATIESFLIRLELEKLRLHQGWRQRGPTLREMDHGDLLKAIIVSADAISNGHYYWIEVAV
jgi:hypothetical protein